MSEKEIGLGRLFVQEAIKAGTWGLIFLLVMAMFFTTIKKDIKTAIAYTVDRLVSEATFVATDPYLIGKSKQLIKEGVEYSMKMAAKEARGVIGESPIVIIGQEMFKDQKPDAGQTNK